MSWESKQKCSGWHGSFSKINKSSWMSNMKIFFQVQIWLTKSPFCSQIYYRFVFGLLRLFVSVFLFFFWFIQFYIRCFLRLPDSCYSLFFSFKLIDNYLQTSVSSKFGLVAIFILYECHVLVIEFGTCSIMLPEISIFYIFFILVRKLLASS